MRKGLVLVKAQLPPTSVSGIKKSGRFFLEKPAVERADCVAPEAAPESAGEVEKSDGDRAGRAIHRREIADKRDAVQFLAARFVPQPLMPSS